MPDEKKAAALADVKPEVTAERQKTPAEIAADEEANEPRDVKIKRLIDGYTHGLASNSPRTSAELAEIKALLAE